MTYQWYRDGEALIGETQRTHYAFRPGDYTVETSSETCPSSVSEPVTITVVNNYNYVIARYLRTPEKTNGTAVTEADLTALTNQQKNEAITYLDGLGRSIHQVGWETTPAQQDLTTLMTYDEQGRAARQYLPYAGGSNGYYQAGAPAAAEAYYQDATRANQGIVTDNAPYAALRYEALPLNRTQQQEAPGAAFQPGTDHTIRYQYPVNDATTYKDELTYLHGEPTLELDTYGGQSKITADQSITLQQGFEVDFQSAGPVHIKAPEDGPPPPSNGAFPALADSEILKLYHYDHYDLDQDGTADYAYDATDLPADAVIDLYTEVQGQLTGTTLRVLDQDTWLTTAMFYDDKGRVIQTQSRNHIGGQDKVTTEYSFHGLMLRQWHRQTTSASWEEEDLTVLTRHEYDHTGSRTYSKPLGASPRNSCWPTTSTTSWGNW